MIPATGSCKKTPEIAGTLKKYSWRKLSGFFSVDSCQVPVLCGRDRQEIIGKISGQNTASTKSPEVLRTGSVRTGLFDLGMIGDAIIRIHKDLACLLAGLRCLTYANGVQFGFHLNRNSRHDLQSEFVSSRSLRKLAILGFLKFYVIWIYAWLQDRKNFIDLNVKQTRSLPILGGGPQDSCLIPCIFYSVS